MGMIEAPRPPWRDEYLHDLSALQRRGFRWAVARPIDNIENSAEKFENKWPVPRQ
jgi:hypothetical protein